MKSESMPSTVVLAIVGSTQFAQDEKATIAAERIIDETIQELRPDHIVSGGAIGVDELAVLAADRWGIPITEYKPKHRRWAPDGYKARNQLIAEACTHLLCIRHVNSKTYGSGWTADYAHRLGKPVERRVLGG